MANWADEFPEHSRTSCSDADRANAHPSGKWCERCTALVMDDAQPPAVGVDVSEEIFERLVASLVAASWEVDPDGDGRGIEELRAALHAALRTGGGAA